MSVWEVTIELPVWFPVAATLAGGVVGVLSLFVSLLILNRGRVSGQRGHRTEAKPSPVVAAEPVPKAEPEGVKPAPVVAPTKQHKPVPPIRQHYWYYVSGVSDRFPTLREALTASGVSVPSNKALDWKKLSPEVRAVVKRVRVDDEQLPTEEKPLTEDKPLPEEQLPEEPTPVVRRRVRKDEPEEDVIRKPIGGGAYVTMRKKRK